MFYKHILRYSTLSIWLENEARFTVNELSQIKKKKKNQIEEEKTQPPPQNPTKYCNKSQIPSPNIVIIFT